MKICFKLFSVALLTFASGSFAEEATTASSLRFRPCQGWISNMGGNGFSCSYPDLTVEVPAYRDYLQTIQALEKRIKALEEHLQELQSGN